MKNGLLILMLSLSSMSDAQFIPDELLASWNFESSTHTAYLSEFCAGFISPISAEYQSIKAIKDQHTDSGVSRRFTLGKTVYQTVDEAKVAMGEINSPSKRSSKHSKMCDMRQAFNVGHVVYFVHTDVGSFKKDLKSIMDKLAEYIKSIN